MPTAQATTVEQIAADLVEKCRKHQFVEAIQAHYAPNIVSVESMSMPGCPRETAGFEAVLEKAKNWEANTELHSLTVGDPLIAKNQFAVQFVLDATCKQTNQKMLCDEVALYTVQDGKIVHEHFYYNMGE